MNKQLLLENFYNESIYGDVTIGDIITMAQFYDIELTCVVKNTIKEFIINKNICHELNKLYNDLSCNKIYSNKLTNKEITYLFNKIGCDIIFK